jgi:hypothetical protein
MLYRGDNRIQTSSAKNGLVFGLGSSLGEPQQYKALSAAAGVVYRGTRHTSLFNQKCNCLKARVVIYPYNHRVRLLSPEPWSLNNHSLLGSRQPTLLTLPKILVKQGAREIAE